MLRNIARIWAAAALVACLAAPAAALDRWVVIINETSFDIVEFYGSNTGTNDWEEDILGSDILPAGSSVRINFDDGTGYCVFDFRAVFDDGDVLVRRGINVCEIGTYRYHE
jgi:hypothetical protein